MFARQVKALLYKFYLQRKRGFGWTLCEILAPILVAFLLVVVPKWAGLDLEITTQTDPQPFPNANAPYTPRPDITMDPFMSPTTSWGLFKELYSSDDGNSCWCKTLAIVGDTTTSSEFQIFMESEYAALKAYYASKNEFFTNPGFTPGFTPDADSKTIWAQCPSANTETFFRIFPTVADLDAFVQSDNYGDVSVNRFAASTGTDRICGAVVFPDNSLTASNPEIHLRFNLTWNRPAVYSSYLTKTDLADDTRGLLAGSESPRRWYMEQGFVGMQILVQRFLRTAHASLKGSSVPGSNLETVEQMTNWRIYPFPTYEYSENDGLEFVLNFSFYLVLCFAFTVTLTIGRIVREREQKIREYMRIMGMYDSAYYVSWILFSMIIWAIVAAGITGMWYIYAFRLSNFGWVYLFNFMFGLASSSFAFFISSLVTKERLGSVIGFFIYTILQFAVPPNYSPTTTYYAFSLLPPSAYVMGVRTIFTLESMNVGVNSSTLNRTIYGYSLQIGFTMLAVDIVLWWLVYYYIEQVNPFLVGYKRPWYFPLSPSFWRDMCSCSRRKKSTFIPQDESADTTEQVNPKIQSTTDPELLQLEAENRVIKTEKLTKRFGNFSAVNGLSVTMYANEIYCLLGHNGAGKTTTFSMLSGLLSQTSGKIKIFGSSVPDDMAALRKSMGVCPQHSALWDELSAFEHLEIFAGLRGLDWSSKKINSQLHALIVEVGLGNRKNFQVKALSGGMKRKLSVGIAFVGDPKVVFLDEPTSGMDPFARRSTWDLLKRKRTKDRVICLTTHYMDEADVLGDRIAIMSHGKLECMGSSMFLKKMYGCGYMLSFMLENGGNEGKELFNSIRSQLSDRNNAKLVSNVGKELIVEVDGDDQKFVPLVESLDDPTTKQQMHIKSFGVSVPNIEEVFLKVSGGENLMMRENTSSSGNSATAGPTTEVPKKRSVTFWTQFTALLERRVRFSIRDWYFFFMQLLFPFFILVVGLALAKNSLNQTPTPITLNVANLNPSFADGDFWQIGGMSNSQPAIQEILFNIQSYCQIGNFTPSSTECNYLIPSDANPTTPYDFQTELLHNSGWPYQPNPFIAFGTFPNSTDAGASTLFGVWQNTTGLHTAALAPLGYFNAWAARASSGSQKVQVTIVNDPLPNTLWEIGAINSITGLVATQVILLALRFIPTAVIAFILLEKEKEIKEQLYISGVAVKSYWLSHFLFDSIASGIASLITIATFYIFSLDAFTSSVTLPGSFALLLLYAPAATAFAYSCSFLFDTQTSGQSFIALLSLIFGNILLVVAFVLQLLPTSTCASCYNIGVTLVWVGRFFPVFALGSGFYALSSYVEQFDLPLTSSKLFGGCKYGYYFTQYNCYAGIGDDLFFLGATAIGYLLLAIIIDRIRATPKWQKALVVKPKPGAVSDGSSALEDEDVLAEKQRVDALNPTSQMLVVNRIMKLFRRAGTGWKRLFGCASHESTVVYAVDSVSFAADKGEVFGLLGNNGAGKTTTFKMLCGLYCPSSGSIHINGMDSSNHMMEMRKIIGYCAQFDAQWDLLTTKEHVLLYAKLRGYKGKELRDVVEGKIDEMNLREYVSVRSGALSGGNRRKLSVAMALVGEPELVFLDEPSCGMDPFARRNMWKIIESVADKRKHAVIILTTHSMEEAEALCSRIAIQVDGKFRCLGTSQEIKHRYGEGHTLSIRVVSSAPSNKVEAIIDSVRNGLGVNENGKLTVDDCKRFLVNEPETVARFTHSSFGLQQAESITVSDFANWVYRDRIFGRVESFMMAQFPGEGVLELVETHGLNMVLKINGTVRIGELFRKLSDNKERIGMEDYQITQTTLEQIFNKFAATAKRRED